MSERQAIIPKGMEDVYEKIGYAPGVLVGDVLYVSGQIGRGPDMQLVEPREAQIVQAFENLKRVVETAGGTLDDIVDLSTFHTDMRDLPLFIKVRNQYLRSYPLPAWTATGAHMLGGGPGYLIEIKAVAHLRKKGTA
ncbi:RidA family protein [Herbaspirillum sp. C9C3]|uniref:RidA family protein n=1 Tax=Herbaspirillum sp. C9C3 TaxID=2735271 RepID=UPI0015849B9B|nr:RidA family protein [Herbaspirillum sp. C9C3]NUT62142.1 RidA family protein [Herbaspirillum sp. C9C3]